MKDSNRQDIRRFVAYMSAGTCNFRLISRVTGLVARTRKVWLNVRSVLARIRKQPYQNATRDRGLRRRDTVSELQSIYPPSHQSCSDAKQATGSLLTHCITRCIPPFNWSILFLAIASNGIAINFTLLYFADNGFVSVPKTERNKLQWKKIFGRRWKRIAVSHCYFYLFVYTKRLKI
jgi:hypothetical protein